jgi:hypothetical protein
VLSCCVALVAIANSSTRLHDLAYARGAFEAKVDWHLYVMMMNSDGFNMALYPIGVASRRYVVDYGARHDLAFQEVRNGVPRTIWRLELTAQKRSKGGSGTLRRMLARDGLRVKSRRLTRAQRASLNANANFVDYSLGAQTDFLRVAFVRKDGTEGVGLLYDPNPIRFTPPFFPIPAEESRLLGFGPTEWHGPGKFDIMKQGG